MWIYTGEKPFTCVVCQRKFSWNGSLNILCGFTRVKNCNHPISKKCTHNNSLKYHLKTLHSGELLFVLNYLLRVEV